MSKYIALLDASTPAKCLGVALWDGMSEWSPVGERIAGEVVAATEDVTAVTPRPSAGWTYAAGAWTAPGEAARPDPAGFVTAVAADGSLAPATRLAAVNGLASLVAAVQAGDTPLITAAWQLAVAVHGISSADQTTVAKHASDHAIPGI